MTLMYIYMYVCVGSTGNATLLHIMNIKFCYKKLPGEGFYKTKVVCIYCSDELSFH